MTYFDYLVDMHFDKIKYGEEYVYGPYYDYFIDLIYNYRKKHILAGD